MRTIAVIPAYNEESTIGDIVRGTLKYAYVVLVVDNNSSDSTAFKAKSVGANIALCYEQGAGAATREGLRFIRFLKGDYVIVTLDGDGQHNPGDISLLAGIIKDGTADLVIGSRFLADYQIPRYRKFGIDIITWLYNVGHKQKITDSQCCFRAFNQKILRQVEIKENGFGFSTEMLIKARKLGFKITEVPISCIYHEDFKKNSTLNPIRHGLEVAFKTVCWRLKLWN